MIDFLETPYFFENPVISFLSAGVRESWTEKDWKLISSDPPVCTYSPRYFHPVGNGNRAMKGLLDSCVARAAAQIRNETGEIKSAEF